MSIPPRRFSVRTSLRTGERYSRRYMYQFSSSIWQKKVISCYLHGCRGASPRLSPKAYHGELILRCLVFTALENTICVRGIDMLIHTSNSLAYEQIQLNCFITAGKKKLSSLHCPENCSPLPPAECQSCLDTEPRLRIHTVKMVLVCACESWWKKIYLINLAVGQGDFGIKIIFRYFSFFPKLNLQVIFS